MRNFLDFISRYNHWLVFLLLEVVSVVLLVRFNAYQSSVWFTSSSRVAGVVNAWEAEVLSYFSLGTLNRELTRRNTELEMQVIALTEQLEKAGHTVTDAERKQGMLLDTFRLIDAKVITNSVARQNNYITIDRGELDGVQPEMGVVCGNGVVGIVYMTSAHYAIVMPVLNAKSNISCRLSGAGYFGYLCWDGRDPQYAYLNDIPRHARFKKGDAVETSGFSAVFPAGLRVGSVVAAYNSDDGQAYRLKVKLSTDFARLRDVNVVAVPAYDELRGLERSVHSQTSEP